MTKILIIAGEASGDQHAADLVVALKELRPELVFSGIGGDALHSAGVELQYHIRELAFLGITEVVRHLPFIRKVRKDVVGRLKAGIDALILVDYPGFNLNIARAAHELGVPVIYYISPQLWAWGEKRVEKVRKYVDLLLVLFKFEVDFYLKHDISAYFVGHPLVDQIRVAISEAKFREKNNLDMHRPVVGLFPGSREMEVGKLLPVMLQVAERLQNRFDVQALIGKASQLPESLYRDIIGKKNVRLLTGQSHALMKYSHAAMVASGTATLELGYLQTPMAVLYSVSPVTYWLGRMLVKIDKIALANIVAGEKIVPEFIQGDVTPDNVYEAISRYFTDAQYCETVRSKLSAIRRALGEPGASQRAARQIATFLSEKGL